MKPGHRLLIKTAILMPSAKKDEVTVVEVESEGYNKKQVRVWMSKLPMVRLVVVLLVNLGALAACRSLFSVSFAGEAAHGGDEGRC